MAMGAADAAASGATDVAATSAIDTSVGASLDTAGGASGFAGAGASQFGASGVGAGAAGAGAAAGAGGLMASLQQFFQNPDNMKMLGDLMKHVGNAQGTMQKSSPEAKQLFQEMGKSIRGQQMGAGGRSGSPGVGSLQPSGPFLGDVANYAINPDMARATLTRLGIPFGTS